MAGTNDDDITKLLLRDSSDDDVDSDGDDIIDSSTDSDSDVDAENAQPDTAFPSLDSEDDSDTPEVLATKDVKRSGNSFASMGLSKLLLTNIQRKGFKVPTPIQRKSMPSILDKNDVVGMARTGSGKTAAFVLPMIERLRTQIGRSGGIRALILSPNRELAIQTLRTVRDFSRKTDLKSILLVGGDSLEDQFGMVVDNPDIVVATPGRFMHLKVEMGLSLQKCEYVVFDEADRLFEMGFSDQLTEILGSLPEKRQTLLFSATLPPNLVEFAKAGLKNPLLIRLDADQKVSDQLQMAFFAIKDSERDAALLYTLQSVIKMPLMTAEQREYLEKRAQYDGSKENGKQRRDKEVSGSDLPTPQSTIVFVPTKHHVEYVMTLLKQEGYAVSYIYGSLDQAARREQLYLFRAGKTSILVVTDVAARGVDIPLLANVINYNMTTSARVFIHRVGRTARAGHSGWAYTLVREQDLPYLVDLELFLARRIEFKDSTNYTGALVLGALPRTGTEFCAERLQSYLSRDVDDVRMQQSVATRGERMWLKSREAASKQGVRKAKEDIVDTGKWEFLHPLVADSGNEDAKEEAKNALLDRLASRKVRETVFEFKKQGAGDAAQMMARRRHQIAPVQERLRKKQEQKRAEMEAAEVAAKQYRDKEFYISHHEPTEALQERGYSFNDNASKAGFQLDGEGQDFNSKQITRWDRKRGKYINTKSENSTKFIRGENGQKIPASLKSGRYEAWRQAHKIDDRAGNSSGSMPTGRRFAHHKEKAPKPADKARDDYKERKEKVDKAVAKGIPVKGHKQASMGLRSTQQIQRERAAKQKRWTKSNQPSHSKPVHKKRK